MSTNRSHLLKDIMELNRDYRSRQERVPMRSAFAAFILCPCLDASEMAVISLYIFLVNFKGLIMQAARYHKVEFLEVSSSGKQHWEQRKFHPNSQARILSHIQGCSVY